jgi:hypothetical protein
MCAVYVPLSKAYTMSKEIVFDKNNSQVVQAAHFSNQMLKCDLGKLPDPDFVKSKVFCMYHETGTVFHTRSMRLPHTILECTSNGRWAAKKNANVLLRMLLRKLRKDTTPIWSPKELTETTSERLDLRELDFSSLKEIDLNPSLSWTSDRLTQHIIKPLKLFLAST